MPPFGESRWARGAATYATLLRVGLADAIAYRAEMLVWMLSMTMPLVSLALWSAVSADAPIGRFGSRDFVAYFLATLVVRQTTGSWLVWQINMEIKSGALGRRLLKPIHPLIAYSAENLASVPVRGLIAAPAALISLLTVGTGHLPHDPLIAALFPVSLFGAWLITFFTMGIIGSVGFFIESSTSIFEIWFAAFMLLSGYIMPIELFPPWVRSVASYLPFRFTLGFPVEALIGMLDRRAVLRELAIQWAFVAVTGAAALVLFRAGTRRYSAYGG